MYDGDSSLETGSSRLGSPSNSISTISENVLPSTSNDSSEYELALRVYDDLVQQYENEVTQLTEADIVSYEARVTRALCQVLLLRSTITRTAPSRPRLSEWLRVVGISPTNIRHLELCGVHDVLTMIQKKEKETKSLAERGRYSPESKRRILRTCDATYKYLDALRGRRETKAFTDKQLSWSVYSPLGSKKNASWRAASAESASPPSPRFVVTSVDALSESERETGRESSCSDRVPASSFIGGGGSFPGTPSMPSAVGHSRCASGSGSLTVLSSRATLSPSSPLSSSAHSTPSLGVSSRVLQSTSMQFGNPPKSPKTTRLVHAIPHKWHRSTKYWPSTSDYVCHFCQRPLGFGFLNAWEKCRSCKWKVHSQCKNRIGDSCGLTPEHIRRLFDKMIQQNNGDMWSDPQSALPPSQSLNEPAFQYPENGSTIPDSSSSTNSSAPSTPAFPLSLGSVNSPYSMTAPSRSADRKFTFPDSVPEVPDIVLPEASEAGSSYNGEDSSVRTDRLGEGSEGTLVVDSTGSTVTDLAASEGSAGGGRSPGGHTWDRHKWSMSTIRGPNSQNSWNELVIPISKIDFKRNAMLGRGRFGYVMRGYHFGDVAVKFLNMDHIADDRKLEEFKTEVAAHRNTRHDNIVLFLGYCIEQDRFGVVVSLCKGQPLYYLLHESKERLDVAVALHLATQICQGVSYLHTKKILHKDLRSKNIFIEGMNKVVITDFGLFSMKRLKNPQRNHTIVVPKHWLAYLAPEMMRALSGNWSFNELPFSESTDVYAFSTIWYELLTFSFPWARQPWEQILWMVGSGMKAPLHNMKALREVKELLMRCWSYSGDDRPSFQEILTLLNSLPRKRLDKSPAYPVIRSFESLF